MGAAIVLGVVFVFLVVILAGLLRGLEWDELRRDPSAPLSVSGVRGIVGGGFLVGLAYGLLVGGQSGAETWRWLSRGVVDGLVVACAGAFYVGHQQRKRIRTERMRTEWPPRSVEIEDATAADTGPEDTELEADLAVPRSAGTANALDSGAADDAEGGTRTT